MAVSPNRDVANKYAEEVGKRIKEIRKACNYDRLHTLDGARSSDRNLRNHNLSRLILNRAELGKGLTAFNIHAIAELYGVSSDEILFDTLPEYARTTQITGLNKTAIKNLVALRKQKPDLMPILEAFLLEKKLMIQLLEVLKVYMYIDLDRMVPKEYAFTSMLDNDAQVLNALMVDSVQEVLTKLREKYKEKRMKLLDEEVNELVHTHFKKMKELKRNNEYNRIRNMEDDFGVTITVTQDAE